MVKMQQKKRLFIGTFIRTDKLLEEYPKVKQKFEGAVWGKWVEDWNLHFTYHFLGEIEFSLVEPLLTSLSPFLKDYECEINLKGLGCFPSLNSPRVLFVNIFEPKGLLQKIHFNLSKVLKQFEIELDSRPFQPHLTLMRIKSYRLNLFKKNLLGYQNFDFGSVQHFQVNLIESRLSKDGPTYQPIDQLS
jgi:2'-5' RNA ligase